MTLVNALLVRVADLVLAPLAGLPATAVVFGAALASALAVLLVMRVLSNQVKLAAVKRRIHAALLEMRLYNDDLGALIRAQGEVLRANVAYVGLSIVPLVVTAVPLTLAIAQLQAWYGYQGLAPGTPVEIAALVEAPATAPLRLEGQGIEVRGPARYFPTLGEVTWQVVPTTPGATTLRVITASGAVAEKTLVVDAAAAPARRSPTRERASFMAQLLYPSEPPLEAGTGLVRITVPYPDQTLPLAWWPVHWLIAYLGSTFVFVLLLRKPLGVVI